MLTRMLSCRYRLLAIACASVVLAFAPVRVRADDPPDSESTEESGDTTGDAAGTPEDETAPESVDVAWEIFRNAFQELASGDSHDAALLLVTIREKHPDHTASVFARPVLDGLRDHDGVEPETIPPKSEWPPLSEHPAVQNRDSAVYDPAWAKYREAFVYLTDRKREAAIGALETIGETFPGHPVAPLAEDTLETLGAAEPDEDEKDEDEKKEDQPTDESEPEDYRVGEKDSWSDEVEPSNTPLRLTGEIGGGAAGLIAGGIVGGFTGFLADAASSGNGITGLSIGASLGGFVAMPPAVYFGGKIANGNGTLLGSYLGALAGATVNFAMVVALSETAARSFSAYLLQLVFPLTGSVIGYELTHEPAPKPDGTASGPILRPYAVPEPRAESGTIGLDVRF